jgi:protein gp37
MGTSVENVLVLRRTDSLRDVPAALRFLSVEPLLGPLPRLNLKGINWVIVGGESGPSARPMSPEWVTQIRDQCLAAGVPFFFKQWGGVNKKKTGRQLDGRTWDEMPATSQGRDQPNVRPSPASRRRSLHRPKWAHGPLISTTFSGGTSTHSPLP